MAIIPGLDDLEVHFLVSGARAREYQGPTDVTPDNQGTPCCVKYIEAVPGAPFCVFIKKGMDFQQTSHHIGYKITVDGREIGFFEESPSDVGIGWVRLSRTFIVASAAGQRMRVDHRFGDPLNAENERSRPGEVVRNGVTAPNHGSFRVDFYRLLDSQGRTIIREFTMPRGPMAITRTSQRDSNGREMSLSIQYPVPTNESNNSVQSPATFFQDPSKRPFATFEFRFKYREDLVEAGIIPPEDIASSEEWLQTLCDDLLSTNIAGSPQG